MSVGRVRARLWRRPGYLRGGPRLTRRTNQAPCQNKIGRRRRYPCRVSDDPEPQQADLAKFVDGPFIVTFTAHIPFPVGVPNDLGHGITFGKFTDADAEAVNIFGPISYVRIRVFEVVRKGLPMWQKGTHAAIEQFYGVQLAGDPELRYGEDSLVEHDQWVTLETPHFPVEGEDPKADPAFAFHRCLRAFNLFLQTASLLTRDIRIRSISSHDLRPFVVVGALQEGQKWRELTVLYMHPEAQPEGLLTTDKPFAEDDLNKALYAIATNGPYLNTVTWRSRAQRALRQTGDAADAIISFQVAAETLLFDTYRMLLVDEGRPSTQISSELETEIPFKSLVTKKLPSKLGGQWDITREETAVGYYWKKLYLIRNSVVHTGLSAHGGHAGDAQGAYWKLRDHLEERLWAKHNSYPRTLLARLGEKQLEQRGWLTASMRRLIDEINNGPQPYHWPVDLRVQNDTESS